MEEILVIDVTVPHVFHLASEKSADCFVKAIELLGHKALVVKPS